MSNPNRALPYAAFTRHLTPASPPELAAAPKPIDPVARITAETIARLHAIEEALAQAQVDVMAHFPEAVRLQLTKLLLATSERTQAACTALSLFHHHGTLTPPRSGAKPRKKPRLRA